MNRIAFSLATVLVAVSSVAAAQEPQIPKPPQNEAKKVHGEGCVEAGVDARCLIVRDVHAGKTYNIIVGDPRPAIGEGIEFTGTLHEGATVCMQGGTAIEVEHWARKESIRCRHTPARPKNKPPA